MLFNSKNSVKTTLATEYGNFNIIVYREKENDPETVILTCTKNKNVKPLIRIHSECMTGDVFHSIHCDCYMQLRNAMRMIAKRGNGAIIYLRQEGRGIGLFNKIKAYDLQRKGADTIEANEKLGLAVDGRDYSLAVKILKELNFFDIELITNNPEKIAALVEMGIKVERVPSYVKPTEYSRKYLTTKKERMGHILNL